MLAKAKQVSRRLASIVGKHLPLWTYRRLLTRAAIGFCYHTISSDPLPHIRHLYGYKTPAMFESDIHFLRRNYELLSVNQLIPANQQPTARNGAFISFDDGLAECYSLVRPILLRHGVPCVFFIMTDHIDNKTLMYRHQISLCIDTLSQLADGDRERNIAKIITVLDGPVETIGERLKRLGFADVDKISLICEMLEVDVQAFLRVQQPYLRSDQIKQLVQDGFTIGAHTKRHPFLGDLTPNEVEEEIVDSCQIVGSITGEKSVPFAFPFSGNKLDRGFLASLRAKHPIIGPMFDTRGLALDQPFIHNRFTADTRSETSAGESNLAALLRREYCSYLMDSWR